MTPILSRWVKYLSCLKFRWLWVKTNMSPHVCVVGSEHVWRHRRYKWHHWDCTLFKASASGTQVDLDFTNKHRFWILEELLSPLFEDEDAELVERGQFMPRSVNRGTRDPWRSSVTWEQMLIRMRCNRNLHKLLISAHSPTVQINQ